MMLTEHGFLSVCVWVWVTIHQSSHPLMISKMSHTENYFFYHTMQLNIAWYRYFFGQCIVAISRILEISLVLGWQNLHFPKGIVKGSFWRYLCRAGRVFRGNLAGTEEFFEVTWLGRNSFYNMDFFSSKLDSYFSNQSILYPIALTWPPWSLLSCAQRTLLK